jgi:hypothetical protein
VNMVFRAMVRVLARIIGTFRLARFMLSLSYRFLEGIGELNIEEEVSKVRYAVAWLLGVPVSIIVIWFVLGHLL